MDLQSSDGDQWFNLTCKSSDRPTFIELSECNISLGKLLDSLNRNLSTKYQFIFRKSTLYEISRYKLFYKFESIGNNTENSRLEIKINKFNFGLGLSTDICKMPSQEQESFTDIDILEKSTELIYPCQKNDSILTTTGSLITDSTLIITTPITTESKDESTSSTADERSASTNKERVKLTSKSYEMAKEGSSSYKDDEIRTESVTSISTEELASRVLTQSSKTDKNELSAQQKQMQAIGSNSKYRTNNYHGKSSLKTTKWPKSQDSKQTTVSVNSDSVLTNDEIVEASKAKLQFLGNVDLKDLFLFFLMIVAVAIMVIEIKSRRKISRQLRNYLFHV